MRVLLLLDDYELNAFSEAVLRLCERWRPVRQIVLSCVAFGAEGPLAARLRKEGVGAQSVKADTLRDYLALEEEGKKFLYRKDRPDLVLAFCRWPAMEARAFHGGNPYVPLILSVRNEKGGTRSWPAKFAAAISEKRTRKWLRKIVAPSEAARRALLERGFVDPQIVLIRPGVNAVEAYPLSDVKRARYRLLMGVAVDTPLLVSVCDLGDPAIEELMAVMQIVRKSVPRAQLFLFGDGAARDGVQERIAAAGLAKSITIVGRLTSILAKVFASADLCLHACVGDNALSSIAESQACETPVIAYRDETAGEVMIDGETGILVDVGNRAAMAEAAIALLTDEHKRKAMGANGRTFILEHYEATNSAEAYLNLWKLAAPEAEWKTTTGSISPEELQDIRKDSEGIRTPLPTRRAGELP